jgi:hypothetical protein
LDPDDNPYLVFESLNAKGKPLTQADLIRNYFFMRIHVDRQDATYNEFWHPMQVSLGENLTEFIRHYLMKEGSIVKQSDVYFALKDRVTPSNATEYLENLKKFSVYYQRLIYPEFEPEPKIQRYLRRLNRIEVTTAYPILLTFYSAYSSGIISLSEFVNVLKTLENYLLRRFVCGIPTNQLNKIFATLYSQITSKGEGNLLKGLRNSLQTKGYPKDSEFLARFREARFYGAGDRLIKTKLIWESLEEWQGHKEVVAFDDLSIEHIMPQTPTVWWKEHLGSNWEEIYEFLLHTIGNLTLTAYNTELSNDNFLEKQQFYKDSHLSLNRYFENLSAWSRKEIEDRSEYLANIALQIWPYFGEDSLGTSDQKIETISKPTKLTILGQNFAVQSWRDVLEKTMNTISDLEPAMFDIIAQNFPRYVGRDKSKFRETRSLQNGYYIEVHLNSNTIQRFCTNAMETVELTSEDWSVALNKET